MLRARLIAVTATLALAPGGWPARPSAGEAPRICAGRIGPDGVERRLHRRCDAPRASPWPGGEAECVVFYFGAGQYGDALANAERWAGQLAPPDANSFCKATGPRATLERYRPGSSR